VTQDEIRTLFAADPTVHVQLAAQGDGSPELAWGDTFCFTRDAHGAPRKMPFATIVIKDYPGFDDASQLNRGGLFRLNIELAPDAFAELFGFAPRDCAEHQARFDATAIDRWFPHPAYGTHGWASIINPSDASRVESLLRRARDRSSKRG